MKLAKIKTLSIAAAAASIAACSQVPQRMEPMTPPVIKVQSVAPAANGTIVRDFKEFSLFEDSKPNKAGDTIVVSINEKTNATKQAKTTTNRSTSNKSGANLGAGFSGMPGYAKINGLSMDTSSANKFAGGGETSAANAFTGTITAIVTEVMENGNLIISGTKQINISNEVETLQFTGMVNPRYILSDGSVSSLNVAEVRVKYTGSGQINESQFMGWLSRIFLNVLPL